MTFFRKSLPALALMATLSANVMAEGHPMPGDLAPSIEATTLDGKAVILHKYRGQPVSLVFLDSLCPMPHFPLCEEKLEKIQTMSGDDKQNRWLGVIKGFYVDESWVKNFAAHWKLKFPVIWDSENELFSKYRVYGNPYQIWIDEQGRIISRSAQITAQMP